MSKSINLFIWSAIIVLLMFWGYRLEKSDSDIDRLKLAIESGSALIQEDTNRIKIYYQLQFLFAPKIIALKLPKEKPTEIHYKTDSLWHILQIKTVSPK
jgi:hypothetical protein